jgi:hypothetical protein
MDITALSDVICYYAELLTQAQTPHVATWNSFFIKKCSEWCLSMEAELLLLSNEECESVREQAHQKTKSTIPPLDQLLDSMHVFFKTLLDNMFTSNNLYLYIMKNYHFLSVPEETVLMDDMVELSNNAATQNILATMLETLENAP